MQVDSLPSEPPGNPKNIGVGSLSLLLGNFLTQESNQGLLQYRWILHQLSYAAAAAKSFQSCLTLCNPIDGSPPGSPVPGILQARVLEWGAIAFSRNTGDTNSIPGSGRSAGEGIGYPLQYSWASFVAQLVNNPPAMRETWVQSLGWEDPLEKGKATHWSILAWRILWTV